MCFLILFLLGHLAKQNATYFLVIDKRSIYTFLIIITKKKKKEEIPNHLVRSCMLVTCMLVTTPYVKKIKYTRNNHSLPIFHRRNCVFTVSLKNVGKYICIKKKAVKLYPGGACLVAYQQCSAVMTNDLSSVAMALWCPV